MLNEKCLVCGKKHETWDEIISCFETGNNQVDWDLISCHQNLSEDFIKEFQNKVNWVRISGDQTLSEDFIKEFQNKVNWYWISRYQTLSEDFIREFKDQVNWDWISRFQSLSEGFIKEFKDKLDMDLISEYQFSYPDRTFNPTDIEDYAEKHNLKIKDGFLYAFRNHDEKGGGMFNLNKTYKKGEYYQDWHLDLNPEHENSYGFGIWPEGNTPIKVKLEDWGTEVTQDPDGKARVKGFEII